MAGGDLESPPPRIILAGPWAPSSDGLFHRRVGALLARQGAHVTYLADRTPDAVDEDEQRMHIERWPTRSCRTRQDIAWAFRRVRYLNPHVVVARFAPVTAMLLAASWNRTPSRIAIASSSFAAMQADAGKPAARLMFERNRAVVIHRLATEHWVYSPGHAREVRDFLRLGRRTVKVCPMGIRPAEPGNQRTTDVVCAARFASAKGQAQLLRALEGTGLSLSLVGSGPEEQALRRLADQLGVTTRFTGQLSRDQTLAELRRARVSVLLTSGDAFPLSVIESLSAGTPVITTSASGPAFMVRHGRDGAIVDRDHQPSIRSALSEVLGPRWQAYSNSARERFISSFELERRAEEHAERLFERAQAASRTSTSRSRS